jgi:hypothetical protein
MSTSNAARLWQLPSFHSGMRATYARVNNSVCTLFLVGFAFCCSAQAANVLIDPGAETGDLTGWHTSYTGFEFVVSTNQLIPNSTEHFLAHSGAFAFQLSDTTSDSVIIYQDFAAIAGSQWSASCYAICYASNYFNPGANAHLQVVFYDTNNNVLVSPDSSSGTGGVYGSDFLDPAGSPDPVNICWIFAPPPAVDASGWLFLTPTNLYNTDPATEASYDFPVSAIPTNLVAPAGTAFVRYQLEFDNSGTAGGAVYWDDCVLNKLNFSDPDITNPPASVLVYSGSPAAFTVGARKAVKGEVLNYQWQLNGADLPPAGNTNGITGATTNSTLTLANCQPIDAGTYAVVVSDTNGSIRSVPVTLTVVCLGCTYPTPPNRLGNPGFENAPAWPPWQLFNGCYFASANDFYGTSTTPVNVFDGNWCALLGANGDRDNGCYQVVTGITPGSVWKAGGWAYISSLNNFVAGNTCRIEVWFKDANGVSIPGAPTYESFKIYGLGYTNADAQYTNIDTSSPYFGQVGYHAQLARDQWIYLPVTNVVNNGGIGLGDDLPYNTLPDGEFVAPNNASQINFQMYEYCPVAADNPQADLGGSASDTVYWDDMYLIQIVPVTNLTASISANHINLSFSARAGLSYAVLYKANLSDATWNVLTNVAAPQSWQTNILFASDTYPITISDTLASQSRFYRVQSQ